MLAFLLILAFHLRADPSKQKCVAALLLPDLPSQILAIEASLRNAEFQLHKTSIDRPRIWLETILSARDAASAELAELAEKYRADADAPPWLAEWLSQVSREVHTTRRERTRAITVCHPHLGRDSRMYRTSIHDIRFQIVANGLFARAYGAIGEIYAALHFDSPVRRSLYIRTLPNVREFLAEHLDSEEELIRYLDKEIDLVFLEGDAWAEIKNYAVPVTQRYLYHGGNSKYQLGGKTPWVQAQETLFLAQLFEKRFDMFFVNGIARDAAESLEALGIRIHGKLDLDSQCSRSEPRPHSGLGIPSLP